MRPDFRLQDLRLPHDPLPVGIAEPVIGIVYRPPMAFDEMFLADSFRGIGTDGHGGKLLKVRGYTRNCVILKYGG